ncbi:MAG TPA: hypothetical protein VFR18_09290, partial [Terriglobia bacterium]|nr:hypothetical protein [Terriglobia bacterium]
MNASGYTATWKTTSERIEGTRYYTDMPRLNYGTLLENIVVLEATRICHDDETPDQSLAFASAFAMPPLTQCWCIPNEETNNPLFNNAFLTQLAAHRHKPQTIQGLWSLCINNIPRVPVASFHGDQAILYTTAGPNGALLASMLTVQRGREIHLWINDDGGRYRHDAKGSDRSTLDQARLLVGGQTAGTAYELCGTFPNTVNSLRKW